CSFCICDSVGALAGCWRTVRQRGPGTGSVDAACGCIGSVTPGSIQAMERSALVDPWFLSVDMLHIFLDGDSARDRAPNPRLCAGNDIGMADLGVRGESGTPPGAVPRMACGFVGARYFDGRRICAL